MKSATSLYLDALRFLAAFIVLMDHASGKLFTGGLLWQTNYYGQTAVMVFFVLSGFVIAHVVATKEHTALDYSAARFGRLYSVIVPALLLTIVCDAIGLQKNPDFYYHGPWGYPADSPVPRYLATFLLINRSWFWGPGGMETGINGPFWSLGFEGIYYVAIGLMLFARGSFRALGLFALAICSGPTIVALAPIWFLGFGAYHVTRRHQISELTGILLWLGGLVLLGESYRAHFNWLQIPGAHRESILADYVAGIGFALHVVGFNAIADRFSYVLTPWRAPIRWLGSITFALYLFHRPLIQVLAVYSVGAPSSWAQRIWLLGGTFVVVATLGRLCEQSKGTYKRLFLSVFGSRAAPAPARAISD